MYTFKSECLTMNCPDHLTGWVVPTRSSDPRSYENGYRNDPEKAPWFRPFDLDVSPKNVSYGNLR